MPSPDTCLSDRNRTRFIALRLKHRLADFLATGDEVSPGIVNVGPALQSCHAIRGLCSHDFQRGTRQAVDRPHLPEQQVRRIAGGLLWLWLARAACRASTSVRN